MAFEFKREGGRGEATEIWVREASEFRQMNQVSGPVVRWIGDLYPIEEMTTEALNQLYSRITSDEACAGDNFDLGCVTQKELSEVKREARAAYKELDRELALRRQQAEISRWQESHMPVENSAILETIEANSHHLLSQLTAYLEFEGYSLSAFETAKSNRISSGWELAFRGGWQLPTRPGEVFLVDSQPEVGSMKHQVTAKLAGHDEDTCTCEDYSYNAGRKGIICKHVIAVVIVEVARRLVQAGVGQKAKAVA
jgi:hypothetical protein